MAVVYFPGDLLYQMHGLTEALLGIYRLVGHWGFTQVFHYTFSVIHIKLKAINYNESLLSVPQLAHVFSCSATILCGSWPMVSINCSATILWGR